MVGYSAMAGVWVLGPDGMTSVEGKDAGEVRPLVEDGGILIYEDAWKPQIWDFLVKLDDKLPRLGFEGCSAWRKPTDSQMVMKPHPLVSFPNVHDDSDCGGHFKSSDVGDWTVLATCSEGEPTYLWHPLGKGGIVVFTPWFGECPRALTENAKAWLAILKSGLVVKSVKMTPIRPGAGRLEMTLAEKPKGKSIFEVTVKPDGGKAVSFSEKFSAKGVTLDYAIPFSGKGEVSVAIRQGDERTVLFTRTVDLPPALTLRPAVGFGVLPSFRRTGELPLVAGINPAKGSADGCALRLTIEKVSKVSKAAKALKETIKLPAKDVPAEFRFKAKFPDKLAAGQYRITAELKPAVAPPLGKAETVVEVLAADEPHFLADADGVFIRDGKPFFPLGIYHVAPESYAEVKELGFNCVQSFTSQMEVADGCRKAEELDLAVLVEPRGGWKDAANGALDKWRDSASTAMWYVADEPREQWEKAVVDACECCRKFDRRHLRLVTQNHPTFFPWSAQFGDVFVYDCYHGLDLCTVWVRRAEACVPDLKPSIFVPFATPGDPRLLRTQAFLGLAHGVKGLVWYCWKEYLGTGRGIHDKQQYKDAFRTLLAELNGSADVLTATKRVPFMEGSIHGIVLGEKPGPCRAFLVNISDRETKAKLKLPGHGALSRTFAPYEAVSIDCSNHP